LMRIALTHRYRRTPHANIVTTRVRGMMRASVRHTAVDKTTRASQQDQVLGCRSVQSRQVGVALRNSFGLRRHVNLPALPTKRRNHVLLSRTTAAIQWKQLDGDKRTRFVGEKVLSPKQRLSL
jgi:hypothetical protein